MRHPPSFLHACAFALCVAGGASLAHAASSFRIDQLYSNLDGSVQYVQLRESAGRDGEQGLGGLVLRVTGGGVTREYTIPNDLHRANTAGLAVLISTGAGVPACCTQQLLFHADFSTELRWMTSPLSSDYGELPARFLPTDGGTVELVGIDSLTYAALPTSGYQALDRSGNVVNSSVVPYWIASFPYAVHMGVPLPALIVSTEVWAREYYHAGLDHYLVTARASDIEALESGRFAGWIPLGVGFAVETLSGAYIVQHDEPASVVVDSVPVCRYYLPPPHGDTHFLSASPAECAAVGRDRPGAILESDATFYVHPADPVTGACRDYRMPVYHLWNGKAAANHRYTGDETVRAEMIAKGWISEGYGPMGVAFCAGEDWWWWE